MSSSQRGVHPRLDEVVRRHLAHPWQKPVHSPTRKAFKALSELISPAETRGLVLDSGCGTGESSQWLAEQYPGRLIIGLDQSVSRLSRAGLTGLAGRQGNRALVRAEASSFWRLALAAGWQPHRHFLLYPNPWPKPTHLQRRWHAHPVFPDLLALGGHIILRTNWEVYAKEFSESVGIACEMKPEKSEYATEPAISAFERKYQSSRHRLWQVIVPRDFRVTCRGTEGSQRA